MVVLMTLSPFPCRGVESLLPRFRFGIQFILWLGCVPFPIVGLGHSLLRWFPVQRLGLLHTPILGELSKEMEGNGRLFVGRYAGVSSLETRDSRCQYVSSVFLRCQDFEDVEAATFPKTSIHVHLGLCVSDLIFVNRVMRYGQHTTSSNMGLDST